MKTSKIYQLEISYSNFIIGFKNADPISSFFSNLTHAVNALKAGLTLNDWSEEGINYSAIYRSILEKGSFSKDIKINGIRFLTIKLTLKQLNPPINQLGIDKKPKTH